MSRAVAALLDGALGLRELQRLYQGLRGAPGAFVDRALEALDLTVDVTWSAALMPSSGPLLAVSNHPFGIADGLAVLAALRRVRPDVKVLANDLLAGIPELRDMLVPVSRGRWRSPSGRSRLPRGPACGGSASSRNWFSATAGLLGRPSL